MNTFAQLMAAAARAARLRGMPSIKSSEIAPGYFSQSLEETNAARQEELQKSGLSLAEKSETARQGEFQQSYNQRNTQFEQDLAQRRYEAGEMESAAKKAQVQGYASTALTGGLGLGYLTGPSVAGLWGVPKAAPFAAFAPAESAALAAKTSAGTLMLGQDVAADMGTTAVAPGFLSYAAPAAAGFVGGRIGEKIAQPVGEALNIGGEKERGFVGKVGGGAAAGAAAGSIVPGVGTVVGAGIGGGVGLLDWVFSSCIIITACTDPKSYEVNVARKYRDAHMDKMELRGYYLVAEKVVPLMKRFDTFKRFVKKFLVNGIIDYCEYATGIKTTLPRRWSAFITKTFLGLCGYIGSRRMQFVRQNGEVF